MSNKEEFKDLNEKHKNELSVYFQALKRAEHISDTITSIRELTFGIALVLPIFGVVKDFLLNSGGTNLLPYITLIKDFNWLLIHDLKLPFVLVFSILSFILILIAKYIETEIYIPQLQGIKKYLINFEKDFSLKNGGFIGFKGGMGVSGYEAICGHMNEKNINDVIKKIIEDSSNICDDKYDEERGNLVKEFVKLRNKFHLCVCRLTKLTEVFTNHRIPLITIFFSIALGIWISLSHNILYTSITILLLYIAILLYLQIFCKPKSEFNRVKNKFKTSYNLFAFWILYLGILVGYLTNIDACRAKDFFNYQCQSSHFQCSVIKETTSNNPKTKETTKCECVNDLAS